MRRPTLRIVARLMLIGVFLAACGRQQPDDSASGRDAEDDKKLYWGDLHNHNSIGQIKGSLERTYDIAESHLDFFAFAPQSQWVDMVEIPQGRNAQFIRGFEAVKANWEKIKRLADEHTKPGEFVAFIGYEVHSNKFGDFHIIFPNSFAELVYLNDIKEWQAYAKTHGAILVPHHPGYKPGWRGAHWNKLDPEVSPIVEMLSEHGNAESDRSPIRYLRHSMGGRYTRNTLQWLWKTGTQAGIVASSDDHLGFPGAYGQGLAAVYADSLTRESLMEALKARRTYAVNGDRIALDFKLNGRWMGETIPATPRRQIRVKVKGEDVIDRVEILRNNRVIYRDHPVDRQPEAASWESPVLCRIEFGWGPWADFNMPRTCDWEFKVTVTNGKILSVSPHLQSRPFDEERRHSVTASGEQSYDVVSYTSRQNALQDKATNDIVLEIQGSRETELTITLTQPVETTFKKSLGELAEANDIFFTGAFSSESVMIHRLVFAENYLTEFEFTDESGSSETDWYYVRVAQTNDSFAWSSPIWVGTR